MKIYFVNKSNISLHNLKNFKESPKNADRKIHSVIGRLCLN